jgi:hypothetical protein
MTECLSSTVVHKRMPFSIILAFAFFTWLFNDGNIETVYYYYYSCSITSTTGRGLTDTVTCQVPNLPATSSSRHLALHIHKLAYVWPKYNYS